MPKRRPMKGKGADIYFEDAAKSSTSRPAASQAQGVIREGVEWTRPVAAKANRGAQPCPLQLIAGWMVETSEMLTRHNLELQRMGAEWARDAAFALCFELQAALASRLVADSTSMVRNLWLLE